MRTQTHNSIPTQSLTGIPRHTILIIYIRAAKESITIRFRSPETVLGGESLLKSLRSHARISQKSRTIPSAPPNAEFFHICANEREWAANVGRGADGMLVGWMACVRFCKVFQTVAVYARAAALVYIYTACSRLCVYLSLVSSGHIASKARRATPTPATT